MSYYGMSGFGGFGAVSSKPVTKTIMPTIKPIRATTTREGVNTRSVPTVDTSAPPEEFIQSQFVADVACAPGLIATTYGCINPDLVAIDPNAPPPPEPATPPSLPPGSDVVGDTKGWWEKRTQNEKILIGAAGALLLIGLLRR